MPKLALTGSGVLAVGALVLIAGGAAWLFFKFGRNALNPLSGENVAYQGAGSVVAALTSGEETTVGGAVARVREWWSGDDEKIRALQQGAPPVGSVTTYPQTETGSPFNVGA